MRPGQAPQRVCVGGGRGEGADALTFILVRSALPSSTAPNHASMAALGPGPALSTAYTAPHSTVFRC